MDYSDNKISTGSANYPSGHTDRHIVANPVQGIKTDGDVAGTGITDPIKSKTTPFPIPDNAAILAALAVLFTQEDVVELRAFPKGRKRTVAGFFDGQHWQQLAELATSLSATGAAVYVTLNPVDPQLLSRYSNRIESYAQSVTTDKQVVRRRWLLIDIDPVRPSGTSATDEQLKAAKSKARTVYGYLSGIGWPEPLVAESGNGMHLLYAIDLANNDESTELIKGLLLVLAERFDDAEIKVDRSVFNAARICKLYGTVANKGDHTKLAPWRLSKMLRTPARNVVTPDQLRTLLSVATPTTTPMSATSMPQRGDFSLEDFLSRHGLAYTTDQHDGSERFKLAACPFNPEHVNGEAAIFRKPSGALGFKCQHDSCSLKAWGDVRGLLDGPQLFRAPEVNATQRAADFPKVEADAADDDSLDSHRNSPRPDPDCLYGLVGDVARAGGDTTEANPYAVAANFIAFMSCAVGRGPYMPVGNTWHHARQFILHIGRSGRGRKGDAVSLISRIERSLKALSQESTPQVHRGGLSSREGLVYLIHDGFTEGKEQVQAILDKRLLVIESEFANVLHQGKREGNTLSAALRDCWDGVSMKPATKTSRLWATDPHIAMIGAVTPSELLGLMASRELTNGFANRFMMFWAERPKLMAFPRATHQEDVDALAERVLAVLQFCQAERWADKDHMRVELSQDARKRYEVLYYGELNDNSAGERITALIERRAPMLLRLAMLFALCDKTSTVEVHHINAALAWVRYSVDSVKFIFGSAADEVEVAETNDTAQKIMDFLKAQKRVTRKQITVDCFKGHVNKTRIDAALDELLSCNPPLITVHEELIGQGRPTKFYEPHSANKANYANNKQPRGFAADLKVCEQTEHSELTTGESSDSSQVCIVRKPQKEAAARMDAASSLSSPSSPTHTENVEVEL